MSYKGKVVIVTGGSSGIGAATAVAFAGEGADVVIVARNETKLNKVTADISKVGKPPLVIKADVGVEQDAIRIIKSTIDKFGKLDVLVNNAGIYRKHTVFDGNLLQVYDEVMRTNLRSVVHLTILAVPHLVKTKGNIVNISSIAGKSTLSAIGLGFSAYTTSKAGMDHFTRGMALELAEKGVRVNTVSPGPVETDIIENAGLVSTDAEKRDRMLKVVEQTALKVFTKSEEIADMILYVASDKARSVTGADFLIDGGSLLKF